MNKLRNLFWGLLLLPAAVLAQEANDSTSDVWERELELKEIVVVASRPVLKQAADRIVYLTKNDPYAKGLNGIETLDRIPRVSVDNDMVTVAGKSSVKYIVDGRLLEMPADAIAMRLKNLQASGIEKIELITTPPAKYAADTNVAFISITTRDESLGTRGNVWGTGTVRDDFSHMLGGNISHTTRKVELSADASWTDTKGINDLDRTYTFSDRVKTSSRTNRFTNRVLGANGIFKYKFSNFFSAGAIANFSSARLESRLEDETVDGGVALNSCSHSPAKPNYALTMTAFSDWQLDSKGKLLSFTYNYFGKRTESFSDISTVGAGGETRLADEGRNDYRIHSAKLDAVLPFDCFKAEAGLAFTGIGNNTRLNVSSYDGNRWENDPLQSNRFRYDENTAAAYVSAEKNFSSDFFGKLGFRYEHTSVKGHQSVGDEQHRSSYGYLFPSLNLSWNNRRIGRFSLSYSMGIARPNFSDLNPFRYYTTTSDYVAGNPDLNPSIAHNAEISYSFKGIYAVLYHSYNRNSIGYVTRFNADGFQYSIPENCIDNSKTGLYASYGRSLFSWWNLNVGGEVFRTYAKSKIADFRNRDDGNWSGKLELNTSWMLNRQKNLVFSMKFSHYFPRHEQMVRYESLSLIRCDVRYMLLNNRLVLSASVSDPFGWNITKSSALYRDYRVITRNDIHSHAVSFRIAYSFGNNKASSVYRDSKERESSRSY